MNFLITYESIYPCICDISKSCSSGIGLGLGSFVPEKRDVTSIVNHLVAVRAV